VEVIAPPALRRSVVDFAEQISTLYRAASESCRSNEDVRSIAETEARRIASEEGR